MALTLGISLDSKMQSFGGRRGMKGGDMSTVDMRRWEEKGSPFERNVINLLVSGSSDVFK